MRGVDKCRLTWWQPRSGCRLSVLAKEEKMECFSALARKGVRGIVGSKCANYEILQRKCRKNLVESGKTLTFAPHLRTMLGNSVTNPGRMGEWLKPTVC